MKILLFCLGLLQINLALASSNEKVVKLRKENPEYWKQCSQSYEKYINYLKEKVNSTKPLVHSELKKDEVALSKDIETIVRCQMGDLYTTEENNKFEAGNDCFVQIYGGNLGAKKSASCKKLFNK